MLDPKIKRLVLKPLAKRKNRAASADVYTRALARLDERALGEDSVRQLRDAITPTEREKRNSNWKDETRARQLVDLANALYSSRRISTSEYVFYAARPVEDIHSARWLDGYYDIKLRPIDNALDAIKEKHGLGPDEDWHRGDGPEEHTQLNIQYETFLDHQFIKLLEEYGLHDLAKLKVENKKEFDRLRERGRRTVFHRNEFSFSVRDVVIRFENEASQAANASAYSAAVICLGAAIEGLLLLRCLQSSKKRNESPDLLLSD